MDASVSFISHDLRPLRAIEGKGLTELVNVCIEVGAKYGRVDASNILPSRFTVKEKIVIRPVMCNFSWCVTLRKQWYAMDYLALQQICGQICGVDALLALQYILYQRTNLDHLYRYKFV